jgi:hypothetical protein
LGAFSLANVLADNSALQHGIENVTVGAYAAFSNTTGFRNVAVGYESLYSNQSGSYNTALGYRAGYSSVSANSVFIGNQAGYGFDGDNSLFVNNYQGDKFNSLIFGQFQDSSNPYLRVNGGFFAVKDGADMLYPEGPSSGTFFAADAGTKNSGRGKDIILHPEDTNANTDRAGNIYLRMGQNSGSGAQGKLAVVNSTYGTKAGRSSSYCIPVDGTNSLKTFFVDGLYVCSATMLTSACSAYTIDNCCEGIGGCTP